MNDETPEETKLTRTKRKWAEEGRFLTGQAGRDRLPPGQHLVKDWPVLDLGTHPEISREKWQLKIDGLVARPTVLDWSAFDAKARMESTSDIHCVTTWSRYDNQWRGLSTVDILELVEPKDEAAAVMLHAYDGYTTNLLLADFAAPDALLASEWNGKALTREHGGPVRLVVPHLYFWKSAKWIERIEFIGQDRPGYWEENGYHIRGNPWDEERYS